MTFMQTILIMPILHAGFFYLQMQVQFDGFHDSTTGELLDETEIAHLARYRFNSFNGVIMMLCAYTWLCQKDLIVMAIRNTMISR